MVIGLAMRCLLPELDPPRRRDAAMRFKTPLLILALAVAGSTSLPAAAVQYSFACITNASVANCADGTSRLQMDVASFGSNQVDFTFRNLSQRNSSVTEIYFDDGTLLGIASVIDSGNGVNFSQVGTSSPPNLPGGNTISPAFQVTAGFVVDTGNGGPSKGVENSLDAGVQEFVTIRFDLINGRSFSDTLVALNGPLGDGLDLRVGLHVKAFSDGGSESFVNLPITTPVPEPAEWAMLLSGLALVAARRRRKH
jgi:hypothetical protein